MRRERGSECDYITLTAVEREGGERVNRGCEYSTAPTVDLNCRRSFDRSIMASGADICEIFWMVRSLRVTR